ncbi:Fe-S-containing hydro-lyase [Sebaldella sp. S0638]|uniref:Fe-S-containing hydro-lyase n=1 Tax=Sebaldella sp. S0638 TaxID=2957809 RepID=UPI0020A1C7B6|nr:Fe-S-containing hydro-lyase [Sebaldella sp. S0638]MCP1222926.1 Fe-S-containing hydro-lyase [Sebaldella sp. S0638]
MNIETPLKKNDIEKLKAGDIVKISGIIYTARDAAHKKMCELLENNQELPFEPEGAVIYYVGPTPEKPGQIIGSAGPTTSGRMDAYTPLLLEKGLKGMIGKGERSDEVKSAIVKNKAVYFAAAGGAAALISKAIISSRVIAWEELGTEAVRELAVKDFPVIVINDIHGNDLYIEGQEKYREE